MRMKTLVIFLAAVGLHSVATAELPPCEQLYVEGIDWYEQGKYDVAAGLFSEAIRLSPEPRGDDSAYTPYIYLAAAQFHQGNMRSARDALIQSQIYGVSSQVEPGKSLLANYSEAIMAADPVDLSPLSTPQSSPVAMQTGLSEVEAELVRARVLKRCALSEDVAENRLPWYFHYLLGLEYSDEGDGERALLAFQMGANIRENPGRNKRLYGMWYLDYLPYFQIARIQAEKGDWTSAREALNLSVQAGEFRPGDEDFDQFDSLSRLVESNLEYADS